MLIIAQRMEGVRSYNGPGAIGPFTSTLKMLKYLDKEGFRPIDADSWKKEGTKTMPQAIFATVMHLYPPKE
jgi:hypothetical protein